MKNIYLSLIVSLISLGAFQAQNSIILNIDHTLGGVDFELNEETSKDGYVFEVTRLQYYMSDISIVHDGGSVTDIADTWILVDANGTDTFELGEYSINNVEGIRFHIGIGTDVNHDDPAAWPVDHPLYPQSPSMHWGWASGYRFVAFEGNAGPNSPDNLFEIHALGDNNYFQTNVDVEASQSNGEVVISLMAEYANAINDIDLSSGLINHATDGASITVIQNFRSSVFSAGATSIDLLEGISGSLKISPNPSSIQAQVQIELPRGRDCFLEIIDMQGRKVFEVRLDHNQKTFDLPELDSGVYIVELLESNKPVLSERWVVK